MLVKTTKTAVIVFKINAGLKTWTIKTWQQVHRKTGGGGGGGGVLLCREEGAGVNLGTTVHWWGHDLGTETGSRVL